MKRHQFALLFAGLSLALVACGGGGDPETTESGGGSGTTRGQTTDGSSDDSSAIPVLAFRRLNPQLAIVVKAFEEESKRKVSIEFLDADALASEVGATDRAGLYVDKSKRVATVVEQGNTAGERKPLGSDVMQIVVPPGNPFGVTDLSVFGLSTVSTALCSPETSCGSTGALILADAGIDASGATIESDSKALMERVATGHFAATLLWRTQAASMAGEVAVLSVPEQHKRDVRYAMVPLTADDGVQELFDWLQSPAGINVLRSVGLRVDASTPS